MEVAPEFEDDDLFFADLSKRISLLIMDDDNVDNNFPSLSTLQAHGISRPFLAPPPFPFEAAAYARETRGTGVFIPLPCRKKNGPARSKHPAPKQRNTGGSYTAAAAASTDSSRVIKKKKNNNNELLPMKLGLY